jgi:prepilin-type N-terminal cleavage/methylation domain-containing protein/prepilin-type processing-associated H-X9-DG protein
MSTIRNQKDCRPANAAFTLIELLVVIAIIAILAGVLLSSLSSSAKKAKAVKCLGFIRQIGIATIQYAGDNDGMLPVTSHQRKLGIKSWTLTLQQYAGGTITFRCPADEHTTRPYTYTVNDFLTPNPAGAPDLDFSRLTRIDSPRATLLFAEATKDYANTDHFHFSEYQGQQVPPAVFAEQVAATRHGGNANYVFADAHVETLSWEQVQDRLRTPGDRFVDPTATTTN